MKSVNIIKLFIISLLLIFIGCESKGMNSVTSNDPTDCRMVEFECTNGYTCNMNSNGDYECLPANMPNMAGVDSMTASPNMAGENRITDPPNMAGVDRMPDPPNMAGIDSMTDPPNMAGVDSMTDPPNSNNCPDTIFDYSNETAIEGINFELTISNGEATEVVEFDTAKYNFELSDGEPACIGKKYITFNRGFGNARSISFTIAKYVEEDYLTCELSGNVNGSIINGRYRGESCGNIDLDLRRFPSNLDWDTNFTSQCFPSTINVSVDGSLANSVVEAPTLNVEGFINYSGIINFGKSFSCID